MLMQRLTTAEADIATLKNDYDDLKATVVSCSCTESTTSTTNESEITALALDKTLQMISLDMMSIDMNRGNRRNL